MKPSEAAWVRENVLPPTVRAGLLTKCACQFGPSAWCLNGSCGRCQASDALPFPETYITNRSSQVLAFAEPYTHPHLSATGAHEAREAMVWLADRACRWKCACRHGCHSAGRAKATAAVQLDLFAGVGA